jgi:hypothetical protein
MSFEEPQPSGAFPVQYLSKGVRRPVPGAVRTSVATDKMSVICSAENDAMYNFDTGRKYLLWKNR